jgi:multidrug efflux pump subunit AcrB
MSFPNLSTLAVRERSVTLFFILFSVVGGIYAFLSLGRAEDPAFTVPIMVVSALWPGATTEEMQNQVANRLEKRIQEVEHLYRIETSIRPGRADLQVEFHDYITSAMLPELFYQVRKRIQDETPHLPREVIGPIFNEDFSDVYFSLIALTAPTMPMWKLTREAEEIRDRLQRVEGVHKTLVLGERSERVYVEFDNARLINLGISPRQIFDAIDNHNRMAPAGQFETTGPRVYLRLDTDLSDPEQLAAVPIRIGDSLLRLDEIAKIRRGYEDPPSYLIRAQGEDTILLGVVMRKGENGLELGERLSATLEAERDRLPLGISLIQLTNQAEIISAAVDEFQEKFLVAVVVVMGVCFLAIGLRAGLVVGIAIPITLGLTFLLIKMSGMNLDRITLGALIIALGLLVDDAIIAIEMMIVKMSEGWDRMSAATHAWTVTAAPMLIGTLVTIAGFFPIGFAQSGVGEYAGNIFWVLAYVLLASWIVAVTFTPYLGTILLPAIQKKHTDENTLYQTPLYCKLRKLITGCVLHRKTVVAGTISLLALSIAGLAGPVQKQFFPSANRLEIMVSVFLPQGSAIATTDAVVKKLEAGLVEMSEVRTLSAYIGAGVPRFFLSVNPEQPDPAFAKLLVVAQDLTARNKIIVKLNHQINNGEYPGARIRVETLRFGPPVNWPVSFRVIGPDPIKIRDIAHQVREIMAANAYTKDPHLEWDERAPILHLSIDNERLRLMGLTPIDVAQQLQFQLDGLPVTEVRHGIRTVEVRVRGLRDDSPNRLALEIKTHDGLKVPLAQVGELQVRYEDPVIKRYNREFFVAVHADAQGMQPNEVTATIWRELETIRKTLPQDYRIDIGGSVEVSTKADASIQELQPVMIALMLVFIILQMRSFLGTIIVVATAPLGLIGAVVALLFFDQPFGFVALLGLTGLAGILMRNTLILTQQVSDNVAAGMAKQPAVVEAAIHRARPVVLTAITAALAFIPLTFDGFWGPLAYVLIGGVLVGTAITLLFVPALYALLYRLGK